MARVYYLIETFQKVKGTFAHQFTYDTSASVSITDGIAWDADKSIETNTDGCSVKLKNEPQTDYKNKIKVDDRIIIYITAKEAITDGNKSSYQRFDGIITEIKKEGNTQGNTITLVGQSRLDRMLNFAFPAVYEPTATFTSTASNIIQALIDAVNDDNLNYQITWDAGNDSIDSANEIQYYRTYRPVIELIEELSQQSTNLEFNAYFYLDANNNFIWKQKSTDADTLTLREGQDFLTYKFTEKVWEVINAMIADAGEDPKGNNIHVLYYDEASAAEYGLKWANTIQVYKDIAGEIIKNEKKNANWVINTDVSKAQFPDSSAYPFDTTFENRNTQTGVPTGSNVTLANDADWISAVRLEAKWQCINKVKSQIDLTGDVKPKIDFTMVGASWELGAGRTDTSAEECLDSSGDPIIQGDYVNLIIPSIGGDFTTGKALRCFQINHELSNQGWMVTSRFEMDIKDAKNYIPSGH
jgi:ribosomal protein L19